ncbi:MAG: hypothetical protein HQL15_10460 [Candidatus Omnitrophica bacterium]|nr:hypothetical protein [Candidatus Omnitrophota bacterium]
MKRFVLIFLLATLTGCSTVQIPNYIKSDRPYMRKISADYDEIVQAVKVVLFDQGWKVAGEVNPSVYEFRQGEDQSKDILIFTVAKPYPKVLYSTYTHINVCIRAIADGAEVEIRYEALTPGPIKMSSLRNDGLANHLLDKIEQAVESK